GWDYDAGAIVRQKPDGSLDNEVLLYSGVYEGLGNVFSTMVVQSDGKIVAAGATPEFPFYVVRLNADLTLDASFASAGILSTKLNLDPSFLQLDVSGDVLVASTGDANHPPMIAAI